uniref:Large ribosomal subunit protein bL19m n=1 Tax=Plectus sambesii TaxID=2011161 RepID=A0A914WX57_9BILA
MALLSRRAARTLCWVTPRRGGSVLAVTLADKYAPGRQRRFVGICIRREKTGLHHHFTLRNVIDGLGVEIKYDLYNPSILKIETLKLERRLDSDLSYLRDALPEYSTFDFDMEPVPHAVGTPVPINPIKVKLRPPPWQSRWEMRDLQGIDDVWTNATAYFKRKFSNKTKLEPWRKYDLIADYRVDSYREDEEQIQDEIRTFEKEQQDIRGSKKRLLKSASHPVS